MRSCIDITKKKNLEKKKKSIIIMMMWRPLVVYEALGIISRI